MRVAICTVNFNGKQNTLDFLDSLKDLDCKGLETQTIVIDSNSQDDSVKAIKEKYPEVKMVARYKNRGSAGGYNDAALEALSWSADYLLMFNNDILINSPNLLKSMLEVFKKDEKIGVVTPKMYFAPGFEFYKEKYKKNEAGHVIWYAGGTFDWENVMSQHIGIDEVDTGKYDEVKEIDFTNITCILVKKDVFEKGIYFDEKLFAYFDDNDWSQRVGLAGFKKYYDGRVSIFHKVSQTSGIGSPRSDYYITRNRLYFAMRYAPLRAKIAVLRQGLKQLFTGRPAQKMAVRDFLMNKGGEYYEKS